MSARAQVKRKVDPTNFEFHAEESPTKKQLIQDLRRLVREHSMTDSSLVKKQLVEQAGERVSQAAPGDIKSALFELAGKVFLLFSRQLVFFADDCSWAFRAMDDGDAQRVQLELQLAVFQKQADKFTADFLPTTEEVMVVYATEELAKTKAEATELKNKYDAIKHDYDRLAELKGSEEVIKALKEKNAKLEANYTSMVERHNKRNKEKVKHIVELTNKLALGKGEKPVDFPGLGLLAQAASSSSSSSSSNSSSSSSSASAESDESYVKRVLGFVPLNGVCASDKAPFLGIGYYSSKPGGEYEGDLGLAKNHTTASDKAWHVQWFDYHPKSGVYVLLPRDDVCNMGLSSMPKASSVKFGLRVMPVTPFDCDRLHRHVQSVLPELRVP